MDNQLNEAFHLVQLHDNASIKQGQAKLGQLRKNSYYPMGLLMYINNNQNQTAQLRAAIQLKLWCQAYFNLEEFERKFYEGVIEEIKTKIVIAYLVFGGKISQTLRPGIVKLTMAEFPQNWNGLMSGLVAYAGQNPGSIHSILLLMQDITHKYSYMSRSDPLFTEIILVCDQIHDFLLDLAIKILQSPQLDQNTLNIFETLLVTVYHLLYQDLHPKFEDNLGNWMNILKQVMNFSNTSEQIFKCKGAALQSILLCANKYKQDVDESTIRGFSSQIWELCSNATQDMEYDPIVFNSLKYFRSIVLWKQMNQFFVDNMGQLIDKLIMPNIRLNKSALESFNDEPQAFFDSYFRNNELHTRRAASLDLLRVICRNFTNFQSHLIQRIQDFMNNTSASVSEKCDLLNFIIDGSCKAYRDVDGCTQTYVNKNVIVECYEHIVKNDLAQVYQWIVSNENKNIESQLNVGLLISLMRYCYFFRIYLPTQNYDLVIKFAASITTQSQSIKSMIYMLINAFMSIRHGDFMYFRNLKYHFNQDNITPLATDILQTIYRNDQSSAMLNENLTRMLYNLTKLLAEKTVEFYDYFDALFKQMLLKTNQYDFKSVHLLFQAIGVVAFWTAKNSQQCKDRLESQILAYFDIAIKRNSDLLNFCFQILAIFLEFQNKKVDKHQQIYSSILNLTNWTQENMSIMSSYIQYISAYLTRSPSNLISDKPQFQVILSKLIEIDHVELFFRFLDSILKITTLDTFYNSGYFKLAMVGIEASAKQSIAGKKLGVLFVFKLLLNYDLNVVLNYMNLSSPNMFESLILGSEDIIRTMQFRRDRKMMYGALCKVIVMGMLQPNVEGSLLNLLIDNSTNRFQTSSLRQAMDNKNQRQKKQSTYQKLFIFNQIEPKENTLEIDEEQELCRTYIQCQSNNRQSLNVIDQKNHERMKRLIDKHANTLSH